MAGMFDDLMEESTPSKKGMFDDILTVQPQGGMFDDLMETRQQGADTLHASDQAISKGLTNAFTKGLKGVLGVLEPLDRPRSAIVAGIKDGKEGVSKALKGEIHPSWSEVMPDYIHYKGVDPDYDPFESNYNGEVTKERPRGAGFVLDMVADPLNLLMLGTLTKGGKAGKFLRGLVETHGDDLAKVVKTGKVDDIIKAIQSKDKAVVNFLKSKGVPDASIEYASKASEMLQPSLVEQAKAGQWSAGRLGPLHTPKAVNVPIAQGISKAKQGIPNIPLVNKFVNRTGDEAYDKALRRIQAKHQGEINDIIEEGGQFRKAVDELPVDEQGNLIHQFERRGGTTGQVKQPWEMTREEFDKNSYYRGIGETEKNKGLRPNSWFAQSHETAEYWGYRPGGEVQRYVGNPKKIKRYENAVGPPGNDYSEPSFQIEDIDNLFNVTGREHKDVIKQALDEGKPIPPEVLKDYPDLAKLVKTDVKQPWEMTREEFMNNPPDGIVYDPNITNEANAHHGNIHIGDRFFELSKEGREHVLTHERAHALESSFNEDDWAEIIQQTQQGVFGPLDGLNRPIKGINGTFTPGENITEGYAVMLDNDKWLKSNYPEARKLIVKKAQEKGFYVPPEVLKDYPDLAKQAVLKNGPTPTNAEDLLNRTDDILKQDTQKLQEAGIPLEQIEEEGYNYFPHVVKEETAFNKLRHVLSRKPKTKTPHSLHREIQWITDPDTGEELIGNIHEFAVEKGIDADSLVTRQASVKEINEALGDKFQDDLPTALTTARLRNAKARHGSELINWVYDEAKADLVKVGDNVPSNWRTPRLDIPKKYTSVDGKAIPIMDKIQRLQQTAMPPAKARILEGMWKTVVNPDDAAKGIKGVYRGYTSLWKRYTLFPFMEYHFRNMVGDTWNGWLNGWSVGNIPEDIATAASMQLKHARGPFKAPAKIKTAIYGDLSPDDIIKAAAEWNVSGHGQYGADEITRLLQPIEKANAIKSELYDLETAIKVGSFLEDNRRLAFFTRRLKEGDTYEEAAYTVTKALFDYNDLTQTEKGIRRWLMPFYTWYRKNLPYQAEMLMRNPGKIATLPKMKGYLEGDSGVAEEDRPEWMQGNFPIHVGRDDKGREEMMVMGNYVPSADLAKFGSSTLQTASEIANMVNPALKIPAELLANFDTFTGRPIDNLTDTDEPFTARERTNYLGMNMTTKARKLTDLLPFTRMLSTADRLNPFGVFDQKKGDFDPVNLSDDLKTRPYHTEMDTKSKILKFITGLKKYPVDIQRQMMFKMYEMQRAPSGGGFNVQNVNKMIKRATMEGDTKSAEMYRNMLKELVGMEKEQVDRFKTYRGTLD